MHRKFTAFNFHIFHLGFQDMVGDYTGFGIHAESRLSFNVIQSKLSPRLGRGEDGLDSYLAERLESAFREHIPKCPGNLFSESGGPK